MEHQVLTPGSSRARRVPTGTAHSADPLQQRMRTSPVSRSKTVKNHSKTAPLCSFRPFLASRLPTSLLAIRGDLRVFPYPKSHKNTRITMYSEHKRGQPVWLKRPGAAGGCCFCGFQLLPATFHPETQNWKAAFSQKITQIWCFEKVHAVKARSTFL